MARTKQPAKKRTPSGAVHSASKHEDAVAVTKFTDDRKSPGKASELAESPQNTRKNQPTSSQALFTYEEREIILNQFQKMTKKDFTSEFLDELFEEYSKFMKILLASNVKEMHCPAPLVDEMWHAHMFCSKMYFKFCEKWNSGAYLHHTPGNSAESSRDFYLNTLNAYREIWKSDPVDSHPAIWEAAEVKNDEKMNEENDGIEKSTGDDQSVEEKGDEEDDDDGSEEPASTTEALKKIPLPVYAIPPLSSTVSSSSGSTVDRYEITLKILIRMGVASKTVPYYELISNKPSRSKTTTYSSSNKNDSHLEKYKFIGFQRNVVFGPGSIMNGVYFCESCARIWEFKVSLVMNYFVSEFNLLPLGKRRRTKLPILSFHEN
jgi:hypothetical protein